MTIVLLIVKIIGGILLALLILALAAVLLVLFVPIRYRLSGATNDPERREEFAFDSLPQTVTAQGHVSWLLHLVNGHISYPEDPEFTLRILCFPIFRTRLFEEDDSAQDREDADQTKETVQSGNNVGQRGEASRSGKNAGQTKETERSGKREEPSDGKNEESAGGGAVTEQSARTERGLRETKTETFGTSGETGRSSQSQAQKSPKYQIQEKTQPNQEYSGGARQSPDPGHSSGAGQMQAPKHSGRAGQSPDPERSGGTGQSPDPERSGRAGQPSNPKSSGKAGQSTNRARRFERKLRYTLRSFCVKMKKICSDASYYRRVLESETFARAFQKGKRQTQKVIRQLFPRDWNLSGTVGFGDPAAAGKFMEIQGLLYPWTAGHLFVEPDFDFCVLDLSGWARGRITIFVLLKAALIFYFDGDIRKVLRRIRRRGTR
ncbi:MAG: hypothetical protein Q4C60_03275 [Eubacteriales bacterium]|nr:hypothetical protein [Eubacteriales bacterium]